MLRTAAVAAVLVASAEAFSTPALTGLRMSTETAQINRKQVLQSAGAIAAGVLAAPKLAGAAALDPNTGFPTGSCLPSSSDASTGCSPMTQAASVLDKQKAVLAGKITVGSTKCDVLSTAVAAMKPTGDPKAKKKKAKFDKEYVLRFNALYLSPLKDAMIAYAERDVNGAKAAGGAGLPKFIQRTSAPVTESSLYQYVTAVEGAQGKLTEAAKKEDADAVVAAAAEIKAAASGLISAANPPVIFN
jgi:hypothetical protein